MNRVTKNIVRSNCIHAVQSAPSISKIGIHYLCKTFVVGGLPTVPTPLHNNFESALGLGPSFQKRSSAHHSATEVSSLY